MFIFLALLLRSYEDAQLLQDMQGVRMTNARACTHAFPPQMQQDCHKITLRLNLRFIAWLPQEHHKP